jgi:SAM-dependent methyltransferase
MDYFHGIMYALNVTHLKQFYASALGEVVARQLRAKITSIWKDSSADITLIIGYPTPLWYSSLPPKNLLIGMPAEHGAMCWPADKNKVFATHDSELPIADNSINRVILLHTLEHSANVSTMMQEIWRVLAPQGRVLAIVPNRMGLWARSSNSPFGYGRPFSLTQLKSVIEESQLTFLRSHSAIFTPPSYKRPWLKCAGALEIIGQMFLPMCGGLHIVEAEKQLYAPILQPLKAGRRARIKPAVIPASANYE